MGKEIIPTSRNLTFGVVIGTYSCVPYVHLGLACLTKHKPNVALMVHDDDSPDKLALSNLCDQYGAEFVSTEFSKNKTVGDLSAFVEGLRWAHKYKIDVLVKLSRRFILKSAMDRNAARCFPGLAVCDRLCSRVGNAVGIPQRVRCYARPIMDWLRRPCLHEGNGQAQRAI